MQRAWRRWGLVLGLALGAADHARAGIIVPLSDAWSSISMQAPGKDPSVISEYGEVTGLRGGIVPFGDLGVVEGTVIGRTHFPNDLDDPPFVYTNIEMSAQGGSAGFPPPVGATVSAYMTYQVLVAQRFAPPLSVLNVPIKVHAKSELSRSGFNASGLGYLTIGLIQLITPFDRILPLRVEVAQVLDVQMYAYAEAIPGETLPDATVTHSVSIAVDPIFSFDQEAFDAQMGASTFPLEDYFEFQFSPNLIPEPPPTALLAAALLALGKLLFRPSRRLDAEP